MSKSIVGIASFIMRIYAGPLDGSGAFMKSVALWTLVGLFLVSGCGTFTDFPVRPTAVAQAADEIGKPVNVVVLDAQNVATHGSAQTASIPGSNAPGTGKWVYRVGPGDVLDIVVWEHPELNSPAGENRSPAEAGLRVQTDGNFFYPFVGNVRAEGRTVEEIRANLSELLVKYIPNPQVVVRLAVPGSQSVSVTGAVKAPKKQVIDERPLTLLDAIDGAGGLTDTADPARVTLRRGGSIYNVNLKSFLENGQGRGNPMLRDGDIVNVPKLVTAEAYLLGQVVKPSTIDLTDETVTLTQALTRVGGLREDRADARGIFVFRNQSDAVQVYQLDASNPTAFLIGTRFAIQPQDVIYVTTAPISKWNQVISNLLPSVTSVGALRDLDQ